MTLQTEPQGHCFTNHITGMESFPSERHQSVSIVNSTSSEFDRELDKRWRAAPLWYNLDGLETRTVDGGYGFIVQLNEKRSMLRRKPECIQNIRQPFNNEQFNFTKIDEKEVLFNHDDDLVAVNVAPLADCHCLVIPTVGKCLPQILTPAGLNLTLDLMFRSASPDLRAGFNSLGGFASVNHLHLHMFYLRRRILLETAPVVRLNLPEVFTLVDYPAKGLVFPVSADDRSSLDIFFRILNLLIDNGIAHNIFITRATIPGVSYFCKPTAYEAIRIYLWARRSWFGVKNQRSCGFKIALAEFAGHIPVIDEGVFSTITEETIAKELEFWCDETYDKMMDLLRKNNVID